ncbi:MAG: EamA family transporter [Oscillospiraceae bacterium]
MLIVILFMKGVQGFFSKKLSSLVSKRTVYISYSAYSALVSAVLAGIVMLIGGGNLHIDKWTLLYAVMCGISISICMIANLMALKEGSVALVNIFAMAGILIPCVTGHFFFQEYMTIMQLVGIILLIGSTLFLMQYNKSLYGKITAKMIILIFIVMISNGTTMLAQKMFAMYVPNSNVSMFSFLSFLIPGILLLLLIKPIAKKDNDKIELLPKPVFAIGAILALALLLVSQLSTVISKALPSVVVFPIVNGGGLIIVTLVAAIFFKEKLTVKSLIGLVLGIVSLIIINSF